MPILTKEVEVRVSASTVKYYEALGYEIPMKKASASTRKRTGKEYVYDVGKTLMVKVEDLTPSSNVMIDYLCDYCFEEVISTPYAHLTQGTKDVNKMACKKCYPQKIKEVCLSRYGVDNYAKTPEFHEKYRNAMLSQYGVEHNSQLPDYREKFHKTCVERYGESYWHQFLDKSHDSFRKKTGYNAPLQVPEIKEKSKRTCLEKYGYEYVLQVPEIKEKSKQTCIERYGVDNPTKSPEYRAKTAKSFYKNGTTPTSKQQLYIYNVYKLFDATAELNYPVAFYNVDICFPIDKLVIEIDFGGHDLSVKLGEYTQEEFNQREIVRSNVIKKEGYKQIHIISLKDMVPSDQILLQMLTEAKCYFSQYPNHSWIEYDIDKLMFRNAECKGGMSYDYGELRKIKQSDFADCNV